MTREEQIDCLCRLRSDISYVDFSIDVNVSLERKKKYRQALSETIEALKQEPITKTCRTCRNFGSHVGKCDICHKFSMWTEKEPNKSEIPNRSTTKNDLGVDCISRAQAKEAIRDKFKDLPSRVEINTILNELPSVIPQEPKWIPVSERLPKPFMYVNATCRSLVDDREDWVVETIYLPIPKEVNKHGYSDWGNIPMLNWGEAEVIAWVERIIPQPYKAESEG